MTKKQNKSLTKFVDFKRYTLIIPAIFLAIALLVFAIWGVNKGYDYEDSYTYDIHFNTTVSSKNFQTYKDIIVETFASESNNEFVVKVTRVNDDISSACKVNVYNNSELSDEEFFNKIESINNIVETQLNQLNTSTSVRLTAVEAQEASSFGDAMLKGIIATLIFMAVAFAYFWFRFELKTALASLIIAPYSFVLVFSMMTIFRIPFTASFMLPVVFSVMLGYILFTLLFDNVRQSLENKDNSMTNDSLVYGAIQANSLTLIALISALSLIFVLLTFLFNVNTLVLCISLLLALIVTLYSAVILPCTLWCMIYEKQNDNRLKARIRILEAREEKKKNSKSQKTQESNNGVV